MKFIKVILILTVLTTHPVISKDDLTYKKLYKDGIVSGFRVKNGHPLNLLDQIPPITRPRYVEARKNLYRKDELCIGTLTPEGWRFSPINVLNHHEVIHNGGYNSLCFCPLAGLVITTPGRMGVSGLLKYDAFLLYDYQSKELILPYNQESYKNQNPIPFLHVQLISYKGVMEYFPNARILDNIYPTNDPYGRYSKDRRLGVGHANPGLKNKYKSSKIGFHPKERVLIIGFDGKFQKAYPFSELKKVVNGRGGYFEDNVDQTPVYIYYYQEYNWAFAEDNNGNSLNVAYSYIFTLYQHRPDILIYRN